MDKDKADLIELMDEDGKKFVFEHLLTFEVDDNFYIAMTPNEPFDGFDTDEVLIMRIKENENGEDTYLPIETQEELDMLWDIFQDIYYADDEEEDEDE